MPIVTTKQLFEDAMQRGYAVPAFNVNSMEMVQAVVRTAAAMRSPVIAQFSKGAREFAGTEYLMSLLQTASREHPEVPLVIHQDHGPDYDMCVTAIQAGATSVMIDASAKPFEENIALTKKVVDYAHARGVVVEAELGELVGEQFDAGEGGHMSSGAYTNPTKAKEFVERTGCDSLAVSIGTSHGAHKFKGEAHLDISRLQEINALIPGVPLVLHGASGVLPDLVQTINEHGGAIEEAHGVSDEMITAAIRHGVVKINVDTDLRLAMLAGIRETLDAKPGTIDMRTYLGADREKMAEVVARKIKLFGSENRF